jgi:hypothetical protein
MKFEIIYHLEGTRKVEVTVPDSVELPDVWSEFTNEQKDAWIFSNQTESKDVFEDIHHATATDIEWAD